MQQAKKLAFISDAIYPYNKGGKEKRIYEITTRLAQRGYDVHIYCMKWWQTPETTRVENGVTLHAISPYYPLYAGTRRSIKQAILFSLHCLKLIKEDFDYIEVDHMPYFPLFATKIVCLFKQKRLTATWNEVWGRKYWTEYLGYFGVIAYILEICTVRVTDNIISMSEHTTSRLNEYFGRTSKVYTLANGTDVKRIELIKESNDHCDIIFSGRLLKHKRVDLIVEAVAKLKKNNPSIRAIIIGNGPEKENISKLINEYKLEDYIEMLDFIDSHNDLYSLMKAAKVFAFPSFREGFGIVAIEANACGIPVVTSNHPDNATQHLIDEGKNGHIFDYRKNNLSEVLDLALNNPINKNACLSKALLYDWHSIASKYKEVMHLC